jgi:hypothetical protein
LLVLGGACRSALVVVSRTSLGINPSAGVSPVVESA